MHKVSRLVFLSALVVLFGGCADDGAGAAHIQLGTANEVSSIQGLQYQQAFVVQVTDLDGNPVSGSSVRVRVEPTNYAKGEYVWLDENLIETTTLSDAERWGLYFDPTLPSPGNSSFIACPAEDVNDNAVLDAGEDLNSNGILEPSHPATLTAHATALPTLDSSNNRISTDENGFGYFSITYPETVASWVTVKIIATANVLGTESTQILNIPLLPPITELTNLEIVPPGGTIYSPYGIVLDCNVSG